MGFSITSQPSAWGKTEEGLTAGRTGNQVRHDSWAARSRQGSWPVRNPSIQHSHTPGHLTMGGSSNAQGPPRCSMPGLTRGQADGQHPRAPSPRAPPRRSANGAPVDSLSRVRTPAPPAVRGRPRPPSPLPHSATPAAPTSGHTTGFPDGPGRAAARPKALTVSGGRAQAPLASGRPGSPLPGAQRAPSSVHRVRAALRARWAPAAGPNALPSSRRLGPETGMAGAGERGRGGGPT